MKNRLKSTHVRHRIAYTVLVAILLTSVFVTMIGYIYSSAEEDGYESLHIQTKEIKEDIQLQMVSDRENLITMANFAENLYSGGKGYDLMFDSFKPIGLISDVGIFTPDNVLITKMGTMEVSADFSFEDEVKLVPYTSGRVSDATIPGKEIVRTAVPIEVNGETVGILYGVTELSMLEEKYAQKIHNGEYQLYVLDRNTGDFIIDTRNNDIGNLATLSSRTFENGYSFEGLKENIEKGKEGYSSFISKISGKQLYIHYDSVGVGDWQIMLALPEDEVFAEAHTTMGVLLSLFAFVIVVMVCYLLGMFKSERKLTKINSSASRIRKLLLEINQYDSSVRTALEIITRYAKSRSSFLVDSDGEDYNFIMPSMKGKLLVEEDRRYFIDKLMYYMREAIRDTDSNMGIMRIETDKELSEKDYELYEFFVKHEINNICFSGVANKKTNLCLLGVVNCKKSKSVKDLLSEIAVCFSMAIYNKKYLDRTELIAVTDSLTGLSNRVAYKKDIIRFDEKMPELFSCIYIDVNELHVINNRYGHAAGDSMLLYIADVLKEFFAGSRIYRMGGDEFLVFTCGIKKETVSEKISKVIEKVEAKNYHISVGMDFRSVNHDAELLVKEAEKRMYEAKAAYYQRKEKVLITHEQAERGVEHMITGIRELDSLLSVMGKRYVGIYSVNFGSDFPRAILIPSYFKKYQKADARFSSIFSEYVHDMVKPDYHRPMLSFLEYDVLRRQILEGHTPSMTYERITGERFRVTVHPIISEGMDAQETLWIFEREDK